MKHRYHLNVIGGDDVSEEELWSGETKEDSITFIKNNLGDHAFSEDWSHTYGSLWLWGLNDEGKFVEFYWLKVYGIPKGQEYWTVGTAESMKWISNLDD